MSLFGASMKLNAKQLRNYQPSAISRQSAKKNDIYIILDNVLDTYNVGALFRLADAVAAEKVFLCGETETPPNPKIKKASVNTWQWVTWQYAETAVEAINVIASKAKQSRPNHPEQPDEIATPHHGGARDDGVFVVAVEQHEKIVPLSQLKPEFPIAVVIGNETYGVSKEALQLADTIVELPMFGINTSLNVMVSCGIVLYKIIGC